MTLKDIDTTMCEVPGNKSHFSVVIDKLTAASRYLNYIEFFELLSTLCTDREQSTHNRIGGKDAPQLT